MRGYGLYLPRLFRGQTYSTYTDIPFQITEEKFTYVPEFYFDKLSYKNATKLDLLTKEMILRGGKFNFSKKIISSQNITLSNYSIIYAPENIPNNAYMKVDFDRFEISNIIDEFNIKSNEFFNNLPVNGFKVFGLNEIQLISLAKEFKKKGFYIYNSNPSILKTPKHPLILKKDSSIFTSKIINDNTATNDYEEPKKHRIEAQDDKPNHDIKDKVIEGKDLNLIALQEKGTTVVKPKEKNVQNIFRKYKVSPFHNEWIELENWMRFFLELGAFFNKCTYFNLYITYIDEIYPTIFIILGILENYYANISHHMPNEKRVLHEAEEIIYYNKYDKSWRKTKDFKVQKRVKGTKVDWYLIIKHPDTKHRTITRRFHESSWSKNIRVAGLYRDRTNHLNNIRIHDGISDFFKKRYGQRWTDYYKFENKIKVNLIGHGIANKVLESLEDITIKSNKNEFSPKDIVYEDDIKENKYHFRNIRIFRSPVKPVPKDKKTISIFLNSNNAINLDKYKTDKNIYLVSRLKRTKNTNDDTFINQISQNKKTQSELNMFYKILNEKNINVPKGIELYAWK